MCHPPHNQDAIVHLSELAGGLAHEIRNPLSSLKVNLQLLSEDLREEDRPIDPDSRRRTLRRLDTLQAEAGRLSLLLDDFLKLVAAHELETRPADLNDLVRQLADFITPQAARQRIAVRLELHPEPLTCRLDERLIKQALLNLALNAQQAMEDGGILTLATRADGSWGRIEVRDTGSCIDPGVLERIFTPFFSTKKEGTGLGLSFARRITDEHGGRLEVRSEPGAGSCFAVLVPRG